MNTNTEQLAIESEKQINYILEDHKDPWNLNEASIWVMTASKQMICRKSNPDVYELLDNVSNSLELIQGYNSFSILTGGWASPIDKDEDAKNMLAPSKHPMRRRVRLVVTADDDGVASVLRFSDDPTEIVVDGGKARGSLADAVDNLRGAKLIAEITKEMNKTIEEILKEGK